MRFFTVLWHAAVVYLGLATVIPTSTASLGSHARPTDSYATAMQLVETIRRADTAVAPGGESILLVHGARAPHAIVLFHGLGNSPRQDRALADSLYERGENVYVPRLPEHALKGANAHDLARLKAEALRDVGDQAIDIASGLGDTVVVLGLSLGGVVAAWAAQFRPEVYRAVIVSPALALAHIPAAVATPLMNLDLRLPNLSKLETADNLRPDRALGWSTHGVGQMLRLAAAVRRSAAAHAPRARDIRIVVNANDGTVGRGAIDDLAARWTAAGADVSMYEFPDSLRLPHDVIDPDQIGGHTAVTYPVLIALVYGQTPPASLVKCVSSADSITAIGVPRRVTAAKASIH